MNTGSFRFILFFIISSVLCQMMVAQESAESYILSEKAQRYADEIQRVENSSPAEYNITPTKFYGYLGDLYDALAMEHYRYYQLEETIKASRKSLAYYDKAGDNEGYIFASEFIAAVAKHLGEYDIAVKTLSEALERAVGMGDKDAEVKLLLQYYAVAVKQKDSRKIYETLSALSSFDRNSLETNTRIDLIRHDFDYALGIGDVDLADAHLDEYQREIEILPDELEADHTYLYMQDKVRYLDVIGGYAEAVQCYESLLSSDSPSPSDMFKYIQILYYCSRAGDEEKFNKYINIIESLSDSPEISSQVWIRVYTQMIISLFEFKKYEAALEVVHSAESLNVDDEWLLVYKASVLHKLGRNEEAKDLYEEYLDVCGRHYGKESLKYASALRYLANIEGFCGYMDSGAEHLMHYFRLVKSIVRQELPFVSYDRLESFWNYVSTGINDMGAYSVEAGITQGELTVAAYEGLVLSKGLLLSSERTFSEYVEKSGDEELKNLYAETLALRERLEGLKKSYSQNKDMILALQPELSLKESSLVQCSAGLSEHLDYLDVTYDRLQGMLKDNEVVIDFVDHQSEKYGRKYIAFVYRSGWKAPLIVSVCNQKELDQFNLSGSRPDVIYGRKNSAQLMNLIWKPFEKYVDKGDVVYLIPSGDMHLLSWDSFQLRNGSLLGSKYDFVRLSSAREIISGLSSDFDVDKAVLYGGLQYDMTEDDRVAQANKYKRSWRHLVSRGGRSAVDGFKVLPMSRKEVTSIAELLKGKGVETKCYFDLEGTEESFVGMESPSPDIIHVATHGFYYTPEDAAEVSGLSGYKDAMRLSGLVMAGGNAEWLGEKIPQNTLGGILTADDIALCDLSGTDLVVLTACDTGKGRVTSEGVYGLQRAFKKAGVQTLIMCLWKADDKASADFMNYFYAALTTNGWNKRKAFISAKDQMREKYRSPYYWAGFFMLD